MSHGQANRLMIVAAVLWGLGNVMQQTVLHHVGPFQAVGLRCAIAAVVLLPFIVRGNSGVALGKGTDRGLLVATVLAFASAITLAQIGYGLTSVTNGGFLVNTATVITPILARVLYAQKPHFIVWCSAMLIVAGAALMAGGSLHGFNLGDALCLASAVSYSFWMVFLGECCKRSDDALILTFVQFGLAGLICLILSVMVEPVSMAAIESASAQLLALGIFSTTGPFLLQSIAQKYTSASEAAIIGSGEAVVGAIAAHLLLSENLTQLSALGAGIIFLGVILVQSPVIMADAMNRRKVPVRHAPNPNKRER